MTKGLGCGTTFGLDGAGTGDLMKPGLTKGDLERIEKEGPASGPDPFGELFREKQSGTTTTTAPAPAPAARAPLPEQVFPGGGFGSYGSGQRRAPLPAQDDIFASRMGTPSNSSRRDSPQRGGPEPNRSCGGAAPDNRLAAAAAVVAGVLGAGDGALAQALGGLLRPQGVPPAGVGAPTGPMNLPPSLQPPIRQGMPGMMHHGGAAVVPGDPAQAALQPSNMALTHCPRPQAPHF